MMTTFGSIAQDGYQPEDDATVVKKMKAAGAIILAKTALPDLQHHGLGSARSKVKPRIHMFYHMIQVVLVVVQLLRLRQI